LKACLVRETAPEGSHNQLIALKEVNQIAQVLDNHKIRLHLDDGITSKLLLNKLSEKGILTFYKNKQDCTPIDSKLPEGAFVLCLQTEFQLDTFRHLGDGFIGIDATHNITQTPNIKTFCYLRSLPGTVGDMVMIINSLIRDSLTFQIGVPVAWMLMSSMMTEIITFFVKWVRDASLSVWPVVIMTDRDQAQITALKIVYLQSWILLCMWHMLCAIRCHFITSQFQGLWEKIKAWVMTDEIGKFFNIWDKILSDPSVPESVVKYLTTEWLPVLHRWSMIGRKDRSIFEEGNTNMLIEAYVVHILSEKIKLTNLRYHHVLKTHCLGSKHNRCIDYIVQALVFDFLPEFQIQHS